MSLPLWEELSGWPPDKVAALVARLDDQEKLALLHDWKAQARAEQLPPPGDWRIWLVLAGRGFGKTRAGAEWVRAVAEADGSARIALVGASAAEARAVMVEGESGLLAICPPWQRPEWRPSLRSLLWPGGASATLYGAAEPERLRGPQFTHGWADELAKWPHMRGAWDNLSLAMRLGDAPRLMVTTTPRPAPLIRELIAAGGAREGVVVTRGRTRDNRAHLAPGFLAAMLRAHGGTRLGRQELDGELIDEPEGALWTRALIERCRVRRGQMAEAERALVRIVVGVDPPASARGDACGIIVAGLGADGHVYVIDDRSVARAPPERWARAVAAAAHSHGADLVIAEANNGGAMVESVLRAADIALPVRLVHASRGKAARAEPVAALYAAGRAFHLDALPDLEDEMCGLLAGGGYEGPGRSPDRADALVWAVHALTGRRGGGQANIRFL